MTDQNIFPIIYLMQTCPFCLKLRIFLHEAGLADAVTFATFRQGDETHQQLRSRMEAAGQQPSFPAAELSQGTFTTGTDQLIEHFAGEAGINPASMPLLNYYSEGVFKNYMQMFRDLRELRDAQPA